MLFASVTMIEFAAMLGNHAVPKVANVVDAFWMFTTFEKVVDALKRLLPLKVLLLVRSVVEETVMEPPSDTEDPLMVSDEFWSWLLPIVDVETKRVPSKARSVPWVYEVALDPPFAIARAEPRVRVPIDAVLLLRNVVVAPALKSASPP